MLREIDGICHFFFLRLTYVHILHNDSFILVLMNFKHMVLEWLISIS